MRRSGSRTAPREVVVRASRVAPRPAIRRLPAPVLQTVSELDEQLQRVVEAPDLPAETLHQIHRQLRNAQLALRLSHQTLSKARKPPAEEVDRRLAQLSHLVGQIRDLDVGVQLLEGRGRRSELPADVARLSQRFRDDAHTGRELLRAHLRNQFHRQLMEELKVLVSAAGHRPGSRWESALRQTHHELHSRLSRLHRKTTRNPTTRRLHRLRVGLRNVRQLWEYTGLPPHHPTRAQLERLRPVQAALGRIHDLDVLLKRLKSIKGLSRSADWWVELRRKRKRLVGSIEREIDRRRIRRAFRRLAG